MKFLKTLAIASSILNIAFAQIPTNTGDKSVQVNPLEQKFKSIFETNKLKAEAIVKTTNEPLRSINFNGEVIEFSGFALNGQMLFKKTDNIGAGRSISTNKVWPGGTNGTSLTGAGLTGKLGEWDGGGVLTTHQEFGSTTSRVTQVDASSPTITHATHVAGTMIAAGVSASAKGMSYQATLSAYDWTNDASEMSSAASNGMLISNHSYGTISGWYSPDQTTWYWYGDASISSTIDYKYGYYGSEASNWDQIANNYPYYLICKAAGNDRGASHTGSHQVRDASNNWVTSTATRNTVGPYDCVETTGSAKNILTVGAVNKIGSTNTNNGWTQISDVVMSSFSGWGPTDDGRIKPDVVSPGVSLYSTSDAGNTQYTTLSGTSMATPAASGSLLLVQQHFNNAYGRFMLSSSLKGLMIHTADEAGNIGPDYTFGWGLINISKAVKYISDSIPVLEKTLTNGTSYSKTLTCDGTKPLRVTICWNDPYATPRTPSLNDPTSMLVNDLDIVLKRNSDSTYFYPYVLNPANPSANATTGNNVRDNVEQIYVAAPQSGSYTLIVSHKGTLLGAQSYSLLISGDAGRPHAAFSSDIVSACSGQTITFSDISLGSPTSRKWYFPGGTPSTSTLQNPTVVYNSPGKYAVALSVTNTIGTDSIYTPNCINIGSLTVPFSETFESNSATLGLWKITNPNNDSTWALKTIGGTTPGNTAMYVNIFNSTVTDSRSGLISPTFSFKGFSTLNLTFKHAYARYQYTTSTNDSLIVYISLNCGTTWTRLLAKAENGTYNFATSTPKTSEFTPSSSSNWCGAGGGSNAACNTINLSSYVGFDNIKIKFESYNGFGNDLYIDNINISGVPIKPVANFGTNRTTVCAGELINFYDSTQNPVSNWQWTFTGTTTSSSTVQNPTGIVYTTPGTYSVKLKATNATGSDSITKTNYITVLPAMVVPNITASGSSTFCYGDSVIFTSDISNAYQWLKDSIAIVGAVNKSFTAKNSGVYKVEIQNASGCKIQSAPSTVIVNSGPAKPTISSTITGSAFCTGGTATLTSSSSTNNQWYKNGLAISGSTNNSFSTTDSGSYNVKIIPSTGCSSLLSDAKMYALIPLPATTNITGNANSNYNKTETYSVVNTGGSTYQWTITNGTQTTGTNTNSIQVKWNVAATGLVQVKETSGIGCSGNTVTLNITLTPATGISNIESLNNFKVYPNPANNFINIEFESSSKQNIEVCVMNSIGQKLFNEKVNSYIGHYKQNINTSEFAKGIYLVEVKSETGSKQLKIVVE